MASRGGNRALVSSSADVAGLIEAAVKTAQRPTGLVVPPASINDSMYGASGEWRLHGGPETVHLPPFKFTIRQGRGGGTRSLQLVVRDVSFPIYSTAGALHRHALSYRATYHNAANEILGRDNYMRIDRVGDSFSTQWKRVKSDIETIAGSYNYDKSDLQTDYFDTGFYFDVKPASDLQAKSYATCDRILSALEVAFPERWARIVAVAAEEEASAVNRPEASTRFRGELDRDIRRALDGVRDGDLSIPFDPKRRGWNTWHSRQGQAEYFGRQKKLKVGMLMGYVGIEPGTWVSSEKRHAGEEIGPSDHEWFVVKLTGGRGGRYRDAANMGRGLASSLESAVRRAEKAMGIEETPAEERL